MRSSQSLGNCLVVSRDSKSALSGLSPFQTSKSDSQSSYLWRPLSFTFRACSIIGFGAKNVSAGSNPSSFLVDSISSLPSADPWDLAVPLAFGAGHAIIE